MDTDPGQQFQVPHDSNPGPDASAQVGTGQTPEAAQLPAPVVTSPGPNPVQYSQEPPAPQAPVQAADDTYDVNSAPADNVPQNSEWQYDNESDMILQAHDLPPDVRWTAAEFVEHPKTASWYGALMLAAAVVAALDYLFTKDFISVAVIIFAAALFGIYAGHKPRMQQYSLTAQGLLIGEKQYSYQSYKSFSVDDEGSTVSILFAPLGRFAPPLTIYVSREMENSVVDYLSAFMPIEQRRNDVVDGLLRRIRF